MDAPHDGRPGPHAASDRQLPSAALRPDPSAMTPAIRRGAGLALNALAHPNADLDERPRRGRVLPRLSRR
jgi:hypothetical protein